MSLKDKFDSFKTKLRGKFGKKNKKADGDKKPADEKDARTDSELAVDEVVREEIFPEGKRKAKVRKNGRADGELAVDEVVREEIFPDGKRKTKSPEQLNKHYRSDVVKNKCDKCAVKPASKRTRPTNPDYEMIDTDHNSCDTSKS